MEEILPKFQLTRYAPTPSGYLHLGNVFSFVITFAMAKKHNAKILLRIDDMDRERVRKEYIQDIFDTLDFLELPFDLGPKDPTDFDRNFSQVHRMELYTRALQQLRESEYLYACDCSRKKLEALYTAGYFTCQCRSKELDFDKPEVTWRMKTDSSTLLSLNDVCKGSSHHYFPLGLSDFVVRKKDGSPAYQLSSIIDDRFFGVDLIVRGQDLWDSSLAQLFLAEKLGLKDFCGTSFYHHPLILNENQQKLSKTAGSTSIQYLRKVGKTKKDILQLIAAPFGWKGEVTHIQEFIGIVWNYLKNKKTAQG